MKGQFRIAMAMGILFVLGLLAIIGKYLWQGAVDNNLFTLASMIVAGLLSNLDRIISAFFPKE